jgi:N-acetylmuramoyl-L-alanine amidase
VVRRVKDELDACGLRVLLTRDDDTFIPLADRSAIANRQEADIFVSVHANAALSRWVEGFEVYYLTEAVDDDARAIAAAENAPAGLDDNFFKNQAQALRALLWDLVYTENRRESVELANAVSRAVTGRLGMKLLGVKGAPFAVLKGAKMPAVLVEVGYLTNRDGLRKLKDATYRQRIAEAIARGIMDFKTYAEASVSAPQGEKRG